MKNYQLPTDVWQQCLWIVRGYERCRKDWLERVQEVGDDFPGFRQMRAVEHAFDLVADSFPRGRRQEVRATLLLFCQDGHGFDFDQLKDLKMTRRGLFGLRQHLLYEIAAELGLVLPAPEQN